jgi:hypothetical protein
MFGDDLDALSWLFDTKVVAKIFSHIIDIRGAGAALREIQELASAPNVSAVSIATKWEEFQACMGPPLVHELLTSGEFREVCPSHAGAPTPPPMDDKFTVWSGADGSRVVAEHKGTHYLFVVKSRSG